MKGESSLGDIETGLQRVPPLACHDREGNLCFSDAEEEPWHSACNSHRAGSSIDEVRLSCASSVYEIADEHECCGHLYNSDCSGEADDECDLPVVVVDPVKAEDCRICHLSLEGTPESGVPIELGCSCKHDLAAAHKQCAETWFKIKGNKICEICGATAKNVLATSETELSELGNDNGGEPPPVQPARAQRGCWQGHRFLNFLLACMIFAFIISWLFHFNAPG